MLLQIATVFMIGFVHSWPAIPAGLAFGLPPLVVALAASLGPVLGAVAALYAGEWLRGRVLGQRDLTSARGVLGWLIVRGAPGLGLLGPLLIGATLAAAIGAALGMNRRALLIYTVTGVVGWTAAFTVAAELGLSWART